MGGAVLVADRKKGRERGAWIVFGDESGTGLTGHITHTWAPAGQTPVLHVVKGGQARLSMAALACYRPGRPARPGPADLADQARLVPRR